MDLLSGYRVGKPDGGPECEGLERELEAFYGVTHARVFNSATSALHAANVCMPGENVGVTALSMSASVASVLHAGKSPIFHDIDDDYGYIGAAVDTVVLPHLFGHHVRRPDVLRVIHDCAQSPTVRPDPAFPNDIWVYSLNQHKVITCGEGGYALTFRQDYADTLHAVRNHGECYTEDVLGWNYRLTEPEAAIARTELPQLRQRIARRRAWANELRLEYDLPEDRNTDWFLYAFRTANRDEFVKRIHGARAGYHTPIYRLPYFAKRYQQIRCPNTERIESELVVVNPEEYGL